MEGARTSILKSLVRQAVAFFAIGHQRMVAGCRCLKENVDALRIESVRYGRVTDKPHLTLVSVSCCSCARVCLDRRSELKYSWMLGRFSLPIDPIREQTAPSTQCKRIYKAARPLGTPVEASYRA
jgi:hypothetical protein